MNLTPKTTLRFILRGSAAVLLAALAATLRAASADAPEFQGILTIRNEHRFSLVTPGGVHSRWLALGDSFEDWTLLEYRAADGVLMLARSGRQVVVPLRVGAVREGPAPTATKATLAEANEVLGKMKFEAMWDRIVAEQRKAMAGMIHQQAAGEFARAGLSGEEIQTLVGRMADAMLNGMQSDSMRKDFARIYAEVYTKEEMDRIADFCDTPAGRAWVDKQPEVQQKMMAGLMPRLMQGMPAAQQIAKDYMREREKPRPAVPPTAD